VKPTVVLSIPRLRKGYARVLENALSGSAIKRAIFFWAKRTGEQWATLSLAGLPIPGRLRFKKKIAGKVGLRDSCRPAPGADRFFVRAPRPLSTGHREVLLQRRVAVIEAMD